MRKLLGIGTAAVLAVAVVGWVAPASAQLTYDNTSTLSVQFGTLPPMVLNTPGGMATVNGGLGGAVGLAGGDFAGSALNTLFSTIAPPLTSLSLINGGNLGGTVTPGVGGTLGILGTVNANVSNFPLVSAPLNFGSLIGAGIGGTAKVGAAPYNATMTYGTWTTGAVTITPTAGGVDETPSVRTGSDNRTALGGGMITLITPIKVVTSLAGTTAVFGILTLNFLPIPEPGTLLLLGSGIAGLAVLGRKKQRNR